MTGKFDVVIEASVSSLHGCHTQARSFHELGARIREAIELCWENGEEP